MSSFNSEWWLGVARRRKVGLTAIRVKESNGRNSRLYLLSKDRILSINRILNIRFQLTELVKSFDLDSPILSIRSQLKRVYFPSNTGIDRKLTGRDPYFEKNYVLNEKQGNHAWELYYYLTGRCGNRQQTEHYFPTENAPPKASGFMQKRKKRSSVITGIYISFWY